MTSKSSQCSFDSQQPYDMSAITIPILQMGKLRPREVKSLARGSWVDLNPGNLALDCECLTTMRMLSSALEPWDETRLSYTICQAQCTMEIQGPLFKRQEESFFLLSACLGSAVLDMGTFEGGCTCLQAHPGTSHSGGFCPWPAVNPHSSALPGAVQGTRPGPEVGLPVSQGRLPAPHMLYCPRRIHTQH